MASTIPRIALEDLQCPYAFGCIATPAYVTAAENLAVGLARGGVAIVALPEACSADVLDSGLNALLLSDETSSLPGCEMREWRVGGPEDDGVEGPYGLMESTARMLLSALCRSSLLRLRGDAFGGMLDDLPLSRSAQGSSLLAARRYVDNFSQLSAGESASVAPLFADPQEEVREPGLLSVLHCKGAMHKGGLMSVLQVQGSDGRWRDVELGDNEVAVVAGLALQHATGGLLRAAAHRVVGEPFGSLSGRGGSSSSSKPAQGHRTLLFELRPRPAAVLDLRGQLEAAGHTLPSRFSPLSVKSLLEQFDNLMSPAAKLATPDQQQGAAAHAAWSELLPRQAAKASKRRSSVQAQLPAGDLPVTRSGHVRRSAEGLVNRRTSGRLSKPPAGDGPADMEVQQAQTAQRAAADRRASGVFSLGSAGWQARASPEAAPAALYVVRGRTCAVVDDCLQDDPARCVALCVRSFTGLERWFYMSAATKLGRVFEMYCARLGISLGAVKFLLAGERVYGASTPLSLDMSDGAELTAVPESADRLQQARELGPLFASVFGPGAASGLKQEPL